MDGVVGQMVGVIAVGMAAGDAEDPLSEQVGQRVPHLARFAPVDQTADEPGHQPVHLLGRLEQNGAAVGAGMRPIEAGDQPLVEQVRTQDSLQYRVERHAGASVVAQVVVDTALVPHRGSCVCTDIGTRRELSRLASQPSSTRPSVSSRQTSPADRRLPSAQGGPTFKWPRDPTFTLPLPLAPSQPLSYTAALTIDMPIPPSILRAASDPSGGQWVLVIGAGCSLEPPTNLPASAACAQEAHRRLRSDGLLSQDCPYPDDLSAVADAVFAETGSQAALVERLPLQRFRSASPNPGHYLAAALLIERSLAGIVTLNFDLALSTALAHLGSEDVVAIVAGPDDIGRLANTNLVYLHRNADAPPEDWVLRTTHLECLWNDGWEPVIATRILVSPVVVFVGIGSPAAVLTSTLTRIRSSLPAAGVKVHHVDPAPFADQPFASTLQVSEANYHQGTWCDFMAAVASRVLSEHVAQFQQACVDISNERHYHDHHFQDLTVAIQNLDLYVFGRIRARWLLHRKDYAAIHAFHPELIADLLLSIGFVASALLASIRLRHDGAIELHRDGRLLAVVGLASGRGVRSFSAVEAALAAQIQRYPWHDPIPARILVTGYLQGARYTHSASVYSS